MVSDRHRAEAVAIMEHKLIAALAWQKEMRIKAEIERRKNAARTER